VPEVDVCLLDKLPVWKRATMVTMFVGRIQKKKQIRSLRGSNPLRFTYEGKRIRLNYSAFKHPNNSAQFSPLASRRRPYRIAAKHRPLEI